MWESLEEALERALTKAKSKLEGGEPRREAPKGDIRVVDGRRPCNRHRQGDAASFRLWRHYCTIGRLLDLDRRYRHGLNGDSDDQVKTMERRIARTIGIALTGEMDIRRAQIAEATDRFNLEVQEEWKCITKCRLDNWKSMMCSDSSARARWTRNDRSGYQGRQALGVLQRGHH